MWIDNFLCDLALFHPDCENPRAPRRFRKRFWKFPGLGNFYVKAATFANTLLLFISWRDIIICMCAPLVNTNTLTLKDRAGKNDFLYYLFDVLSITKIIFAAERNSTPNIVISRLHIQ